MRISRGRWISGSTCGGVLWAGVVACTALLHPGSAAAPDHFAVEVRLGVDRTRTDIRKLRPADQKAIQEVLAKRLPILADRGGKGGIVQVNSFDDILARVPVDKVGEPQLEMFGRRGVLEFRHLDDVQTTLNPDGRYLLDIISIQNKPQIRFRDRKTNQPVTAEAFIPRCPLVVSQADIAPDSARAGEGSPPVVSIQFTDQGTKRLQGFASKPGRLLAMVLDSELLSINASVRKVRGKKKGSTEEVGQMDITGACASPTEANYLAVVFNSGALPCPLTVRSTKLVAE
jgi:preprotein translocase subunit SecD